MMQNTSAKPAGLLAVCLLLAFSLKGQHLSADLNLIRSSTLKPLAYHEPVHQPEFLFADHPSALVRYNPFSLVFGGLMWIYQKQITQQLYSTCIYSPTCSSFSISLIREYGLLPGMLFTADRLSRCNRLALYDFPAHEVDHEIHRIRQEPDYYRFRR